jgi:hypothetical protein
MENQNEIMEATFSTPETIAQDINSTFWTINRIALQGFIYIGQRLEEAKELVEHGEWIPWLEKNVAFSRQSAANYIRIYHEFGAGGANDQLIGHLSYTNALRYLSLGEDDKKEVAEAIETEDLSADEIQEKIDADKQRAEDAEAEASKLREGRSLDESLRADLTKYKAKAKEAEQAAKEKYAKEVEKQVAAAKQEIEEKAASATKEELEALKAKLAAAEQTAERLKKESVVASVAAKVKFALIMTELQTKFNDALNIQAADPELSDEDRIKMKNALKTVMGELIKRLD